MLDKCSMLDTISYFSKTATKGDNGFTLFHETFKNPYLGGACSEVQPIIALEYSLKIESVKQRRKQLLAIYNNASKKKRKTLEFERMREEIGTLLLLLNDYI